MSEPWPPGDDLTADELFHIVGVLASQKTTKTIARLVIQRVLEEGRVMLPGRYDEFLMRLEARFLEWS